MKKLEKKILTLIFDSGQLWVVLSVSRWDCLLTNTISQPRPHPPPPTLSWFTTYQERYKQGTLFEPVSWLNWWHDFFCAKNIPGFAVSFSYPFFVLTNFSAFSENPTFESFPRFCFIRLGVPLAMFLHTVCQQFCQPSEPCSDPCFSFCSMDNGERGRGGGRGVKCEEGGSVFNHEFSLIGPPRTYTF